MANRDISGFFGAADRALIEAAVREAETRTSGEIVPYAVASCDDYEVARWRALGLGALLGALAAALAFHFGGFWGGLIDLWIAVPPAIGGAAGFLLASAVPALRRALVSRELLAERVAQRAASAFLEQEVFATRDRTGILILVALFERRVAVLGDSGINAAVEQREWDGIVAEIVAGIKAGSPGRALAAGIGRCGELLERHRVARRTDDFDELPDHLRTERKG